MSNIILKEWKTKEGYMAAIMQHPFGHNCGYVGVKKNHPLYGKSYSQHCDCLIKSRDKALKEPVGKRGIVPVFCYDGESASMDIVFNIHGGITFAETTKTYPIETEELLHWIGFDCSHLDDTPEKCDLDYCINECENLSKQLSDVLLGAAE